MRRRVVPPSLQALPPRDPPTLDALLALDALCFREDLRYPREVYEDRLARPGAQVLAATREGAVVGFALCDAREDVLFLDVLAVHPDCRREGLGARLVEASLDLARRLGLRWVEVHAELRDQDGYDLAQFYARAGFAIVEDHADWRVLRRAA